MSKNYLRHAVVVVCAMVVCISSYAQDGGQIIAPPPAGVDGTEQTALTDTTAVPTGQSAEVAVVQTTSTADTISITEQPAIAQTAEEPAVETAVTPQPATYDGPVTGTVRSDAGEPLSGAVVAVKGSTSGGTITDGAGNFTITAKTGDALEVSFYGYQGREVPVGVGSTVDVALAQDVKVIDNVVVTALGIKRSEQALNYNVQTVSSEELNKAKNANFVGGLANKVAGVQIQASSGPGSAVKVVARGDKSIEHSNGVLYVIDGIPMYSRDGGNAGGIYGGGGGTESAADINPEDIESINMLTGPSAAALYGSQAANGVILINTKKGKEGQARITISNSTTFSNAYMMPEMQNTYGTSMGFENWGTKYDSSAFEPRNFFDTGYNVMNAVSLSLGSARNQTYVSAASTNAKGILPGNTYNRYNFSVRNTSKMLKDKITLDFGAGFILQEDKNMPAQGIYDNPLTSLYLFPRSEDFNEVRIFERFDPTTLEMTQFWPYGEGGSYIMQNPYWIQKRILRETDKKRYMFNMTLSYQILDWLSVSARGNVDHSQYMLTRKMYAGTNVTFAGSELGGYSEEKRSETAFYGDVMLNVNKAFLDDRLTLNVHVGASIDDKRYTSIGGRGALFTSYNEFVYNNIDFQNDFTPIHDGYIEQTQSVFASAEIGWNSMVFLTGTARNEWASQLAFSNQSSYFYPSVGLSAVISNMFRAPQWLSLLKVRASYSSVASPFSRYLSNPAAGFDPGTGEWSRAKTFPIYNLKPERTDSWELGLDARFFGGKLTFDLTYYRSNTFNQTIYAPLPPSSGYDDMIVQAGNIQNQGIELALGYNNKWSGFGWATTYTFSTNRNRIISLGSGIQTGEMSEPLKDFIEKDWLGTENLAPRIRLVEGGSMSDIYVNHELARDANGYIEVNPSTGAIRMVETDYRKVGQLSPKATMGWSNTFSYGGEHWGSVDLGVVISARIGGLVYSATQGVLDYYGTSQASADARGNGGVPINFGKIDAKTYYQTVAAANGGHGAYYLYSATNVRLQELTLSYTLPAKWFRDKARLTVGFVATNLAMIYCKAPFDPELTPAAGSTYYQGVDYFGMPSTRNLGFNVKLSF